MINVIVQRGVDCQSWQYANQFFNDKSIYNIIMDGDNQVNDISKQI